MQLNYDIKCSYSGIIKFEHKIGHPWLEQKMITDEVDSEEKEEAYLFQEVKGTKFETADDDTRRFSPIRRSVCSFCSYHPANAKGFLQYESGIVLM